MEPTIQLIQLMMRVEREAEAHRHRHGSYGDNFEAEKSVCSDKCDHRSKPRFTLPRRRQPCECSS